MIPSPIFWIFSAFIIISSFFVVMHKDLLKSALFLALTLLGTAFFYIALRVEFLGWIQVLLYVGGVMVLILFVVMLAKEFVGKSIELPHRRKWIGGITSFLVFIGLTWVIQATSFPEIKDYTADPVKDLPRLLFKSSNVLPFEVLSLLLIGAFIGAVVLARRD